MVGPIDTQMTRSARLMGRLLTPKSLPFFTIPSTMFIWDKECFFEADQWLSPKPFGVSDIALVRPAFDP